MTSDSSPSSSSFGGSLRGRDPARDRSGGRRRGRRVVVLLAALLGAGAVFVMFRWDEWQLQRDLDRLCDPNSGFLAARIRGEVPSDLAELRDRLRGRPDFTRGALAAALSDRGTYRRLVALDLAAEFGLERRPSAERFLELFVDADESARLGRSNAPVFVHGSSTGVHGIYETGLLFVQRGDPYRVEHVKLTSPSRDPVRSSLAAAARRFAPDKASVVVRHFDLDDEQAAEFDRSLLRLLALPEFPHLVGPRSHRTFCDFHRAGEPDRSFTLVGWPWIDAVFESADRVARGPAGSTARNVGSEEGVGTLLRSLEVCGEPEPAQLAAFAIGDLDPEARRGFADSFRPEALPGSKRADPASAARSENSPRLEREYWIEAIGALLGDAGPLERRLEGAATGWPPLDDPRLGRLLLRRLPKLAAPLVDRTLEIEADWTTGWTLAGLLLDSYSDESRAGRLRAAAALDRSTPEYLAWLEGAADNPRVHLTDGVLDTLEGAPDRWPTVYLLRVALALEGGAAKANPASIRPSWITDLREQPVGERAELLRGRLRGE